jgi:adenosylmethionine-8-amino-7-oxononanoate aminotransferase
MSLSQRDQASIWHPYTQMQTALPPIGIIRGEGAYLYDESGKRYIDAVASWWTNLHGHAHPALTQAIAEQAATLEHVIFAGFTHEPAIRLAEMLLAVLPETQKKIFYSDNGSTAVEVALKMSLQYWHNQGQEKTHIIAFKESYHGDTFGAMSVSGRGAFTKAFEPLLFDVHFIETPLPGREKQAEQDLQDVLEKYGEKIAAFIYEPLIQGTAGMRMMQPEALDALIERCKEREIFCIADEVMTGFGRTGKMFASFYLKQHPDIVCLSKGLTGGMMAFGVTSCTQRIYNAFLSSDKMKTFFHGHSYTANPIACAAGIASLELFAREKTLQRIALIEARHQAFAQLMKGESRLSDIRVLGVILALELKEEEGSSYFSNLRDKAYSFFLGKGILIRPLGNILYLLPPYCISDADLDYIYSTFIQFIESLA